MPQGDALRVIDAQIHLAETFGESDLRALLATEPVDLLMVDEYWYRDNPEYSMPSIPLEQGGYRPLSPLAEYLAVSEPSRFGVLRRIDRHDPEAAALIRLLADLPSPRGIRFNLRDAAERCLFADGAYDELLAVAAERGVVVCLLQPNPESAARAVDVIDGLQVVLDHCGYPEAPSDWEAVLDVGGHPSISLKWAHGARLQWDGYGERVQLSRAVSAFGTEGVLWASDLTMDGSGRSWSDLLKIVTEHPEFSSAQKHHLLYENARRLFTD
ncbi:amidohydrolase family protein [Rhodococcus sp. NPDC127530]|uniref:amidohydrolase family protein n=1 Tax=unclassified Rhodococcus (in: high G+C Gram-positive bacteria) TaxID=192944 RepID=UPI0036321CB5